jgi:hypothetical protein
MVPLGLKTHVSYGLVRGRPVFLDLRRDRYVALEPAAEAAFSKLLAHPGGSHDPEERARLLATGLFAPADKASPLAPVQIAPVEREPPETDAPGRTLPGDILSLWWRLVRARHMLATRPLERVLAEARRTNTKRMTAAPDLGPLAARCRAARSFIPLHPRCLPDTLAAAGWLATRGLGVTIVLGVALDPFSAHCWLQSGDTVLNDRLDIVTGFTPVLALPCG